MLASSFSSSSSNQSLHPPPSSLNSSSTLPIYQCFDVILVSHIFTALLCSYVLFLLPLCLFTLHLGHQQWRRRHSISAAGTSNLDLLTYNIVAMELIGILGSCFFCYGTYADAPQMRLVGVYVFTIVTPGQMFFHSLTCVERYLAVIHPVIYMGLRKARGVRISNISIGLSVLRALIRPGPGEGGGDRDRMDQLKRRAFQTIAAITGALLFRPMDMNANTSSSQNVSQNVSSNCFTSPPGSSIFITFTITNILLLFPLSIYILYFGFQHWRQQRRSETMNPIDVFTYHMVAMELIGICASIVCCCGGFTGDGKMTRVGCNMFAIISCVKMFFHSLTCVERYTAVVHPITYMSLSKTGGVLIRNISIGCVWLLCAGLIALRLLVDENFNMILFFCNLALSLIVSSFCSLSVLRILIRPGPGDDGGNRGKIDKSKQKAFITITAIMAVLLVRFGGNLVCMSLFTSSVLSSRAGCVVRITGIWFCLPSSYVLPLLFLHRVEKLPCIRYDK
ncbi:hypothetical protein ABVT39_007281 [Epinephelus coioides]